jgi:hypothetical protein
MPRISTTSRNLHPDPTPDPWGISTSEVIQRRRERPVRTLGQRGRKPKDGRCAGADGSAASHRRVVIDPVRLCLQLSGTVSSHGRGVVNVVGLRHGLLAMASSAVRLAGTPP